MVSRRETVMGGPLLTALAAGAAFGIASVEPAQATERRARAMPVHACGAVLSTPGRYYLANDLTCNLNFPTAAITITASNVTLDLAGRTIAGSNQEGIGITVGAWFETIPTSGVRITGGTVTGFSRGVFLDSATEAKVTGVTVTGVLFGIQCENSLRAAFVGNALRDGLVGFDLDNCNQSRFVGNEASGHEGSGLQPSPAVGSLFVGNIIRDNGGNGIRILNIETRSAFIGNLVTGNTEEGILVTNAASGNRFQANIVTGNGPPDIVDIGINLGEACDNSFRGNIFGSDNETGTGEGPGAGCIQ